MSVPPSGVRAAGGRRSPSAIGRRLTQQDHEEHTFDDRPEEEGGEAALAGEGLVDGRRHHAAGEERGHQVRRKRFGEHRDETEQVAAGDGSREREADRREAESSREPVGAEGDVDADRDREHDDRLNLDVVLVRQEVTEDDGGGERAGHGDPGARCEAVAALLDHPQHQRGEDADEHEEVDERRRVEIEPVDRDADRRRRQADLGEKMEDDVGDAQPRTERLDRLGPRAAE